MKSRFVALGLFLAVAATASAADVSLIAGKKFRGEITAVDAQNLTVRLNDGTITKLPLKELSAVELGPKPLQLTAVLNREQLELVDGSILVGTSFGIAGKAVRFQLLPSPQGPPVPVPDIPLGTMLSFLRNAEDAEQRGAWKQLVAGRGKRDLFVIKQPTGFNPLPGTVIEGNEAGDRIEFELETGNVRRSLPLSRATGGLVFNQPPRAVIPPTICKVLDVYGNVLFARTIELTSAEVVVTTVAGAVVRYRGFAAIAKLDFSQGNIAYLSDLEPVVQAPPPTPLEPVFTYLNDRTPQGPGLLLGGSNYDRGIWMNPETTLTFPLGADFREFKTVIGLDDRIPVANSAVQVTIEADGREVFSARVSRKDGPKPITVDVKNVNELRVTVDQDSLFLGNHLILGDARVLK